VVAHEIQNRADRLSVGASQPSAQLLGNRVGLSVGLVVTPLPGHSFANGPFRALFRCAWTPAFAGVTERACVRVGVSRKQSLKGPCPARDGAVGGQDISEALDVVAPLPLYVPKVEAIVNPEVGERGEVVLVDVSGGSVASSRPGNIADFYYPAQNSDLLHNHRLS